MKLGVAGIGMGVGVGLGLVLGAIISGCGAANVQYASNLQQCITRAKYSDAGTADERLALYNACADALDKDGAAK